MEKQTPWWRFWSKGETVNAKPQPINSTSEKGVDDRPNITALPPGRQSSPQNGGDSLLAAVKDQFSMISPQFMLEQIIPVIRSLAYLNPNVSQTVHNIVSLGNTGHKIFFDRKVPPELVDKMRNHLMNKRKNWASGQAGMHGLVNKMFAQLLISGALSNEWVPNASLNGIEGCVLVNPENIRFKLDKNKVRYKPFQIRTSGVPSKTNPALLPLNENTYKYFALNGDEEMPYGIPPYLSVINGVKKQKHMDDNIDFIVDIMGLVGFLEALIQKPDQNSGEADDAYQLRLNQYIAQAKTNIMTGLKDGVVVGFEGDHTFNFNSASKTYDGVAELYKNNELSLATALKQDPSLWGRDYGSTMGAMGIVFMKMLSELKNIQTIVKENLEFGYALELRLAGYKFDYLTVQFNRSTIQDDLKYQQSEEIKVRNTKDKLLLGIIDLNQAADELGYEAPAESKPVVDWEVIAGVSPKGEEGGLATDKSKKKQDRKAGKNKSARTSRRKAKPNMKDEK